MLHKLGVHLTVLNVLSAMRTDSNQSLKADESGSSLSDLLVGQNENRISPYPFLMSVDEDEVVVKQENAEVTEIGESYLVKAFN